jgi:hypothetical protein
MVQPKEKKIKDGEDIDRVVNVTQFVGSRANKNFVRFQQCLQGNTIIVTPEQWQDFCNEFLSGTAIDGKDSVKQFDDIFTGNIGFLLEVVIYISEVNFGKSFLGRKPTGNIVQP